MKEIREVLQKYDESFVRENLGSVESILFGQYDRLLKRALAQIKGKHAAKILQLTCVYGKLTPKLLFITDNPP